MNSLRSRLTLTFALVAVLPLALTLLLFGRRLQHTLQSATDARLTGTLAGLREQVRDDAERLSARLTRLAGDPSFKRMALVPGAEAGGLAPMIAEQRELLALDGLWLADTSGQVVADGADAPAPGRAREPLAAWPLAAAGGVRYVAAGDGAAIATSAALHYVGRAVLHVQGAQRLDERWLARLARVSGVELALADSAGRVLATTLAGVAQAPADTARARDVRVAGAPYRTLALALHGGDGGELRLVAFASTAAAAATLAALQRTALLLGLAGVMLALVLGVLNSRALARPVEQLAAFSERVARGDWDEPLALEGTRELEQLIDALERMRRDLSRYRDGLRASERQAAYGQMARQVAHEIKNPLTPIAVSMSDLKRSYELQRPDFASILEQSVRTVNEEVQRLKRLLADFNELGRFPAPRKTGCRASELAGALRDLHRLDVESGRLGVACEGEARLEADPDQLRQALLNLVQNALEAAPGEAGRVAVTLRPRATWLEVAVSDNGPGLNDEQRSRLFVPGFTSKPGGNGIGLTLVERIVSDHGGTIEVRSAPGHGTTFELRLPLSREA